MGISVLGGDVEGKLARIFNGLITKFDEGARPFLIGLLEKDRVQGRVQLLPHIL